MCAQCRARLEHAFRELPGWYARCARVLANGGTGSAGRPRPGTPSGRRATAAAAELCTALNTFLRSWCERTVTNAPVDGSLPMAAFLAGRLDELVRHPEAGELLAGLDALIAAARQVAHPNPLLHTELGPCRHPGCDRVVRVAVRVNSELPPPRLSCDAGHPWLPAPRAAERYRPERAA
ncbi:hypothetical protein [Amycolatopsis albispora]|uniref:Uncharacterized protein n=1 Tax=Amycolatopsis albispora TaxID=1804986 RepID=A0A344LH49_9PSEU|nr:hypothetical protein [Amycolatopsis albispora]AXB47373.1 hypothetical protein A4R43_37050 [Amycolatopsis albispora]